MNEVELASRKLDLLAQAFRKSDERTQLEDTAFSIIKDGEGIERGEWVSELITNYPDEVMAVFDGDPMDIEMLLSDMWDCDNYEDEKTGLSMSWSDWATFFSNNASFLVYNALVEKHKECQRLDAELAHVKEQLKRIKMIIE
ncbi:MAG: hypothetical protein IJ155_04250 [Prevotella sp.]|nr:hypothetical protein [Prevotella sp.]